MKWVFVVITITLGVSDAFASSANMRRWQPATPDLTAHLGQFAQYVGANYPINSWSPILSKMTGLDATPAHAVAAGELAKYLPPDFSQLLAQAMQPQQGALVRDAVNLLAYARGQAAERAHQEVKKRIRTITMKFLEGNLSFPQLNKEFQEITPFSIYGDQVIEELVHFQEYIVDQNNGRVAPSGVVVSGTVRRVA
jgi:hypothetical protein